MSEVSLDKEVSLESLVAQVADEFMERQRRGERPDVEEFAGRHPEATGLLRRVLASLEVIGLSGSGPAASGEEAGAPAQGTLGDFRILPEVGRGGMGVVYEAEQISLGRRVALKVLPFAGALDGKQLQRFKNEAQATAGLHHTNIVPVHFVGCERGVHFYAMQFIDGQNLAQVIAALRLSADGERSSRPAAGPLPASAEAPAAGPLPREPAADPEPTIPHSPARQWPTSPAPDTVPQAGLATERSHRTAAYFRTAARLGQQAAEALHHAHELGVVHRDVKPGNLLLDGRGNVWVTDFGLAHLPTEASLTLSGDLVGTVRYMSPEQALAQRVGIDHRTDVYSLGATLYELLTLRPVFAVSDRQQLLRQIAFDDPVPPRRFNKALPAELETVVLKALEKRPEERYATAQELADDLGRFLKDEPVRARRPTLLQRCRRWMRRHKPLVGGAAAALLAALLVLAGGLGWLLRDREARRTETERAVKAALDEAARQQSAGRVPEALAAAQQAAWLVDRGVADEALRQRVQARRADLELLTDLEEARLEMAAVSNELGPDFARGDRLYAAAFQKAGLDIDALPVEVAVRRIQRSSVAAELAAALSDWALTRWWFRARSPRNWRSLLRIARLADPDWWRSCLRQAIERLDKQALVELAGGEEVRQQRPLTLATLAKALRSRGAFEQVEALQRQAQQRRPGDFWFNFDLGQTLAQARPPRWDEAIRYWTTAVALRPSSPFAHANLGLALGAKHRLDDAIAEYREAIRLKKDFPEAHLHLGIALKDKGQLDEAIAEHRKAIRLKKDFPEAHFSLGHTLFYKGLFNEAIIEYREAGRLNPRYDHSGSQWFRNQERFVELDKRLPAILSGEKQPANAAERLAFANLCQMDCKQRFAAASKFYAEAFAADPQLAGDPASFRRYSAARAAALAGCGQGKDAGKLDAKERSRLREQARDWLAADLRAWDNLLQKEPRARPAAARHLARWLANTPFAGVRGEKALQQLPQPEREAWHQLWTEVAKTLGRARSQPK
jgi:serine/threonine protein kinase/Flp pilus assembly protein TadD